LAEAKQRFQCVGKLFAASQCAILKIFWIYQNSASPDQNRHTFPDEPIQIVSWQISNNTSFVFPEGHGNGYQLL
jgi:hypothetical protein